MEKIKYIIVWKQNANPKNRGKYEKNKIKGNHRNNITNYNNTSANLSNNICYKQKRILPHRRILLTWLNAVTKEHLYMKMKTS